MTQFADLVAQAKHDGIQKIGVGAFIRDLSGRLLVLQRAEPAFLGNMWEIPSGGVAGGESWEQALVREVRVATGLLVSHIGEYIGSFDYKSGSGRSTREHHFEVIVADAFSLRLSPEHKASAWISDVRQLGSLVTLQMKQAISHYLDRSALNWG